MAGQLPERVHTTVLLSREDKIRLEKIARDLGILQTRGVGTGEIGSCSALMVAIARGHLIVRRPQDLEDEE